MSRLLSARHHQPCSAAVLYFSAQPDQCYPGAGTGSEAGAFQDGKLCGEPDAAGRTRTNECKIDASPCLRSKEMSKEKGSAGEDEAPPQGRLVPSPQHKAACFLPWLPDKTKYDTRKGALPGRLSPSTAALKTHRPRLRSAAMKAPVGLLSGRTVCDSRWRDLAPTSSTNVSKLLRRKK